LTFRKDAKTWQPGVCRSVAGCKCPRCRRHYDSTGHWDSRRATRAQSYIDMLGFNMSVSCAQGPLITTMHPTNQRNQPVTMGPVTQPSRHRHREQYHDRRIQQSLKRPPLVSALQPVLVSSAKLHTPVAQHTALMRRPPQHPNIHTPVLATTMATLVCASLAQGPSWDKARLLVDSSSEHPPLISTRMAQQLGLEGQGVSAATQANGDILPLSDVGSLELCINGLPITEKFLSAPLSHYDIILGESWLRHHRGIMDYAHDQLWQLLPSGPVPLNFDILPPGDISCLGLKPSSTPYVSHTVDWNLAAMVMEGCRLAQQPGL